MPLVDDRLVRQAPTQGAVATVVAVVGSAALDIGDSKMMHVSDCEASTYVDLVAVERKHEDDNEDPGGLDPPAGGMTHEVGISCLTGAGPVAEGIADVGLDLRSFGVGMAHSCGVDAL